jgi:hypothetical protein
VLCACTSSNPQIPTGKKENVTANGGSAGAGQAEISSTDGKNVDLKTPQPNPAPTQPMDPSEERVIPPSPIAGSYLNCLINDKDLQTQKVATLECLIKDSEKKSKVKLAAIYSAASFSYQLPEDSSISVKGYLEPEASPFHARFVFSGNTLSRSNLERFLVMFRASPVEETQGGVVVSARLGQDSSGSLLPEKFSVYYKNGVVLNQPAPGFKKRILPTINRSYIPIDGCYLACYSKSARGSSYSISSDIFVMGQFRSKGVYEGRICRPQGIAQEVNVAEESRFKKLCTQYLPACAGDICWVGGDTGGWYGLK